ncbi:MAG: glycosyltransferase family 2 protein, partial [Gemmatimonadales bacterium]
AALQERPGAQALDTSQLPPALRPPASPSPPLSGGLDLYARWRSTHCPSEQDQQRLQAETQALENQPRISIMTPVYNVDARWLERCVQSVVSQLYPNWELCLVDDGSTRAETLQALETLKGADPRIKLETLPDNRGISAATNSALQMATGEFIALLDNDDELTPDALLEVAALLDRHPEADFIYSDEDKLNASGQRCEPFFKPDWSPELLRSYAYTCHLTVVRKALVESVGGFRSDYDGAQDYDLTLRVSEQTKRIFHIPRVLYHWRKIAGSAADRVDAKRWGLGAARRALADHARRVSPGAEVLPAEGAPGCFRVRHRIHGSPLVSILIPTRGQTNGKSPAVEELLYRCVRSIMNKTDYCNYEVLVAYNNSLDPDIAAFFEHRPHRLLNYPLSGRFNFPHKLNWMARQAQGEHLVIFNDDLEAISPDWLTALLEFSQQEEIGAVGSKLLYPDGRLQHIGMALGINGYPAHLFHQAPAGHPGYMAHANLIRNYSAVTGAALMMRRALYDELGGLSEEFSVDYNDTDLCLRLLQKGYRVVYTPYSLLHHHESAVLSGGRLNRDETELFRQRWRDILANDPLYNPNLTRTRLDCGLDA